MNEAAHVVRRISAHPAINFPRGGSFPAGTDKFDVVLRVSEVLSALAFGGHTVYDSALDLLRSAPKPPPLTLGRGPPPITETMTLPTFKGGPPPPQPGMVTPQKPKQNRAGWVE